MDKNLILSLIDHIITQTNAEIIDECIEKLSKASRKYLFLDENTKIKGICFVPRKKKNHRDRYKVQVKKSGKQRCIGYFDTFQQAYERLLKFKETGI
jgi:hypothetical protein